MKTRWYRKSGVKGLLVLLTIVFVTVACTGAGASVLIMSKGVQQKLCGFPELPG